MAKFKVINSTRISRAMIPNTEKSFFEMERFLQGIVIRSKLIIKLSSLKVGHKTKLEVDSRQDKKDLTT
jgi:hypothetical protein